MGVWGRSPQWGVQGGEAPLVLLKAYSGAGEASEAPRRSLDWPKAIGEAKKSRRSRGARRSLAEAKGRRPAELGEAKRRPAAGKLAKPTKPKA